MEFKDYIIQERGELFYKLSLIDMKLYNPDIPLEEWFSNLFNEYRVLHGGMKITIKKLDPTGIPFETQELDTILSFPWRANPIETEAGPVHQYEETKKWRCLLEIGDYAYYVRRDGELEKLGGFKGDNK